MNNKENILFYSKKCEYCSKIINLINDIDSFEKYKFICVDENKQFPYIQRVPTLMVKQIKKPLIGINAFNWIKSTSQFNRITNNINAKPNKFNNPNDNPLLYDIQNGLNGMNNKNNFLLKNGIKNIDNISYIKNKNDEIYTLPEGSKINKSNQKKKLNALLSQRAQQEFKMFGSELDTSYSSDKTNIFIDNDLNEVSNRINNINFAVEQQSNLPSISSSDNSGINTSRIIVNRK